jgi:MFS family permease
MSDIASARGWYYGWNIVVVSVLAQISANGVALIAFSLFLKDWSAELRVPISSLQLAYVPMLLVSSLLSPLAGSLADKYQARWLMFSGLLGIAITSMLISLITSTWQLYVLYGTILPVSICFSTNVVANALVSRWFVQRRGLALGLTAFGVGFAGVVLPPAIAATMPTIGWRFIWRVASLIVTFLVAPLVLRVLRDRPSAREGLHYVNGHAAPARDHSKASAEITIRWGDILGRRNFWLLLGAFLPILSIYGGSQQNLAPIAASHGFSQWAAGTLLSVLSVSQITSSLALGLISDRFGNRVPLAALAFVVAIGAALIAFGSTMYGLFIAVAIVGMGGGLFTLLAAAIAAEFGPAGFGRAFGLLMAFIPAISIIPFAVARIQELTGSYTPGLLAMAVLAVVGGALSLLMRERTGELVAEPGP